MIVVHDIRCHAQLIIFDIFYDFMIRFTTTYGVVTIDVTIFVNTNYYTVCYHQYRPHYGNCTVTSYLRCSIHYVVPKYYQEVYCCDCLTKDTGYEFLTALAVGRWKLKGGCLVLKIDF